MSRLGIVIGDVSGKGAPAAIYAALVSGIIRSHAPIEPGPAEMLSAVNLSLAERRIEAQFVSIIYAVWDDEHPYTLRSQIPAFLDPFMFTRRTKCSRRLKRLACLSACLMKPITMNSSSA